MVKLWDYLQKHIDDLTERYPVLALCDGQITAAFDVLSSSFKAGGKMLVCGNGGSASDAEHIAGELMKSFLLPRPISQGGREALTAVDLARGEKLSNTLELGLPVISLTGEDAFFTAFSNDKDPSCVFAQQVAALGKEGDIFFGITTSGNSENVVLAAVTAKAAGLKVVALTGKDGGEIMKFADVCIRVPETETYKVQELHLPVYHCLCMMLEEYFFGGKK